MGPSASISRLLERSQAPHVMLSDQDDVRLPEKIAVLLGRMRRLEEALGGPTPILVHSDLIVVDSSLRTLHPSFWTYRRLDPVHGATLRRLAVENVVAGCSAIINRALVEECLPIPQQAIMHDWWIALVAAARGRIESVAEPLTLYRQHAVNAVGVRRPGLAAILGRTGAFFTDAGFHGHLGRTLRQAQALLDRFDARLSEADRAALSAYATLADCGCLRRRWRLLRHGFRTSSCLGNVKLFFGSSGPPSRRSQNPGGLRSWRHSVHISHPSPPSNCPFRIGHSPSKYYLDALVLGSDRNPKKARTQGRGRAWTSPARGFWLLGGGVDRQPCCR